MKSFYSGGHGLSAQTLGGGTIPKRELSAASLDGRLTSQLGTTQGLVQPFGCG